MNDVCSMYDKYVHPITSFASGTEEIYIVQKYIPNTRKNYIQHWSVMQILLAQYKISIFLFEIYIGKQSGICFRISI